MFMRFNQSVATRHAALKKGDKGFTLIELLVVIIIIGILAAIAIPVFLNQRSSAWKASVQSDLKNAAVVIETYGTTNGGDFTGYTDAAPNAITKTSGNTITVSVTKSGYVLRGTNSNLTAATDFLVYDSQKGGLGKWGVTP